MQGKVIHKIIHKQVFLFLILWITQRRERVSGGRGGCG